MKVLIVDDSGAMRKHIKALLSNMAGITQCDEASEGKKAIFFVKVNDYDLVLMDWNMPGLSGLEVVKEIRALGKEVPIIMVTTNSEKSQVVEAIKAGANNYIVKPFDLDVFISKCRQTLSSKYEIKPKDPSDEGPSFENK